MYTDLTNQLTSMQEAIMGQVQIDEAALNSVSTGLSTLSSAVETFLAGNPVVPAASQADLDAMAAALTAGQQAQTDLANATPPAPTPTPTPGA
jgi:hypothetical protein